ncbi:hypothetical protein M427DRAFT_67975 [Gonapodya prolifera JEL478]|uniref:F-box domain-containing protein n=1 Tax=Gonapodya prolifera (strain JEL478) TaxID=1344416 RepID=A0A139AN16_GONPJ|nr:hypothetical protein M427DRAFT_67975 [Gonapodya prolifera JEL478]|eukprot:KXS18161.1 hypothetical protein M427DRAFT_67975 [Gonapodya prolifera JEL478]
MAAARLPHEIGIQIMSNLDYKNLARVARVCRSWRAFANEDTLWRTLIARFELPIETAGTAKERFAAAFESLRPIFDVYPAVAQKYQTLVKFLSRGGPSRLVESLNPGANLEALGFSLGEFSAVNSPYVKSLLAWYALADGQKMLHEDEDMEVEPPALFGSFECYGDVVNPVWLPVAAVQTFFHRSTGITFLVVGYCRTTRFVLCFVAKTPSELGYLLGNFVTLEPTGQRYIDFGPFGEFMARYVDEVVSGERSVDRSTSEISMFKKSGRGTSLAVTQGIEVHVSSICCLHIGNQAGQWSYNISMRYVTGQCPYPSVQLESRKWQITYRSGRIERVEGPAVVGHYPKLSSATPTFSYRSFCAGMNRRDRRSTNDLNDPFPEGDPPVSMMGSFVFVPGSRLHPTGEKFEVEVGRWEFEYPLRILGSRRLLTNG